MDTKHISITDVIERLKEFPIAWKRPIRMSILKWGTRCLHTWYRSLPMASEITTASM